MRVNLLVVLMQLHYSFALNLLKRDTTLNITSSISTPNLHPRRKPHGVWTEAEDNFIIAAMKTSILNNEPLIWKDLATQLNRPYGTVYSRYRNNLQNVATSGVASSADPVLRNQRPRGWTADENELLLEFISLDEKVSLKHLSEALGRPITTVLSHLRKLESSGAKFEELIAKTRKSDLTSDSTQQDDSELSESKLLSDRLLKSSESELSFIHNRKQLPRRKRKSWTKDEDELILAPFVPGKSQYKTKWLSLSQKFDIPSYSIRARHRRLTEKDEENESSVNDELLQYDDSENSFDDYVNELSMGEGEFPIDNCNGTGCIDQSSL